MNSDPSEVSEAMLSMMVTAALGGHDLAAWESLDETARHTAGWESRCRVCRRTVWVGQYGQVYSVLKDECPGPNPAD